MTEMVLESMIINGKGTIVTKYGTNNEYCGYVYAWMTKNDFNEMQKLKSQKQKIEFFVAHVRYVGKDVDGSRHDGHLLPFEMGTPFDRYLKIALLKGVEFVSIYLKVREYATIESILLKKLFDFGPMASSLLNKNNGCSLQGITDKEMNVMFYSILSMLTQNPSHINCTTKAHITAVKNFFGHFQDVKKNNFKRFVAKLLSSFETMDSIGYENFAREFTKLEFDEFIKDSIESGIAIETEKNQYVSAHPSKN